MKTKIFKLTVFLCCFLPTCYFSNAQNYLPYVPTPQTWDFMAYGNVPIGHYTGRLDMQIPIYHYKDKDFDIPISIGYNAAGFVPSKPAGPVGLNWFLNCGGVITRQIVEYPDEMDDYNNNGWLERGVFYRVKHDSLPAILTSNIFNFSALETYKRVSFCLMGLEKLASHNIAGRYETNPDIFSFNFFGHSGKFVIDQSGVPHVYNCAGAGTYTINLDKLIHKGRFDSEIKITTGDGYVYVFGGNRSALEQYQTESQFEQAEGLYQPIVSWYLTKIIASNGREVNFEYIKNKSSLNYLKQEDGGWDDASLYVATYTPQETKIFEIQTKGSGFFYQKDLYMIGDSKKPMVRITKAAFLEKIVIDGGGHIDFINTEKEICDINGREHAFNYDFNYAQRNYKLDLIKVYTPTGDLLKNATFNYEYRGKTNEERMFLRNLTINQDETYTFDYYDTHNLPGTGTKTVDYWGFWNGGDNVNAQLIPSYELTGEGDIRYTSGEREPNSHPYICRTTLLSEITYPTRGKTRITYEPHSYSRRLERRSVSEFLPKLFDVPGKAGGARVKKMEDIDENGTVVKSREFLYQQSLIDTTSSGVLESWPIMVSSIEKTNTYQKDVRVEISSSGISINSFDEAYIGYTNVIEKLVDGSCTEYAYSSYETNPDIRTPQNTKILHCEGIEHPTTDPSSLYRNIHRIPNSTKRQRGKLLSEVVYNSQNDTVRKVSYSYADININPSTNLGYVASIGYSGNTYYSYQISTKSYLPVQVVSTLYGEKPIAATTSYSYNHLGLQTTESQSQSDGSYQGITARYVGDIITDHIYSPDITGMRYPDGSESLAKMFSLNMLSLPIEQIEWTKRNDSIKYNAATHISYRTFNDILKPHALHRFSTLEPTSQYQMATFNGVTHSEFQTTAYYINRDPRLEQEMIYNNYDSYGNLLQHTGRDGTATSYLWGYNGLYPVVKAVGADYNELHQALGGESVQNRISHNELNHIFAKLRNNLPSAHIYGYSYKPLVGISSEVEPDGLATHYSYDKFGRLTYIRDHNNNILKQYEHHYANKNDVKAIRPSPNPNHAIYSYVSFWENGVEKYELSRTFDDGRKFAYWFVIKYNVRYSLYDEYNEVVEYWGPYYIPDGELTRVLRLKALPEGEYTEEIWARINDVTNNPNPEADAGGKYLCSGNDFEGTESEVDAGDEMSDGIITTEDNPLEDEPEEGEPVMPAFYGYSAIASGSDREVWYKIYRSHDDGIAVAYWFSRHAQNNSANLGLEEEIEEVEDFDMPLGPYYIPTGQTERLLKFNVTNREQITLRNMLFP